MNFHSDWYHDGVEAGEDLWRLDWPNIQAQLFIQVDQHGRPTELARLFIEYDLRDASGDVRTHYACDGWAIEFPQAVSLLCNDRATVWRELADKILHVLDLPNRPEYCGTHDEQRDKCRKNRLLQAGGAGT